MTDRPRPEDDLPKQLRWFMIFIDRVGFPIVAFLLMSYMCFVSIHKMSDALTQNTEVLAALKVQIMEHREWSKDAVKNILEKRR